jgi:hypothetical protein
MNDRELGWRERFCEGNAKCCRRPTRGIPVAESTKGTPSRREPMLPRATRLLRGSVELHESPRVERMQRLSAPDTIRIRRLRTAVAYALLEFGPAIAYRSGKFLQVSESAPSCQYVYNEPHGTRRGVAAAPPEERTWPAPRPPAWTLDSWMHNRRLAFPC